MNKFAIDFLNNVKHGEVAGEETKQRFIESAKDILDNGYYIAYSHSKGFHASQKKKERLERFKNEFDVAVNKLFSAMQ